MLEIVDFVVSTIRLLYETISILPNLFINGLQYFVSTITTVPLFIIDLFHELPEFMQVGLSGILGLFMFIVFLKLFALLKLN